MKGRLRTTTVITPGDREQFAAQREQAAEELLRTGELPLHCAFYDAAGQRVTQGKISWSPDPDERSHAVAMLRAIGVDCGATAVCVSSEAWRVDAKDPLSPEGIAAHPDSVEHLLCVFSFRKDERLYSSMSSRRYIRDADGKLIGLADDERAGCLEMASLTPNGDDEALDFLIQPRTPSAELRAEARKLLDRLPAL
jgi:hypothetical protein